MNVKISHRLFLVFSIAFLSAPFIYTLPIQAVQKSDEAARAQTVIAQMRKSVFGEIKLENVKGLSLSWKARHQTPNGDQHTGEATCDLLLPNKMFTKNTRVLSGNLGQVITYRLLNGEQSRFDVDTSGSEIPIVRSGGSSEGADQVKLLQTARREQAFQLIRLALPPSPDFPLAFAYAGEAQASDGRADMIDVKGPNDFSARLFIDKATSRLLMLTFSERGSGSRLIITSRELSEGKAPLPKDVTSQGVELKLRFSDYRLESGVMLPHLVTYESNGRIITEYELKDFKLNPVFAPDHFDPGKKRK